MPTHAAADDRMTTAAKDVDGNVATDDDAAHGRWRRVAATLRSRQSEPSFVQVSREKTSGVAVARGRAMSLTMLCRDPRVVLVSNFLSRAEAEHIIAMAQNASWLHSSAAVDASAPAAAEHGSADTSSSRVVSGRSNKWCCVGHESPVLVAAIERACWLCGLQPSHAEELQVVHYAVGQQYEFHVDHYTDRDVKDAALLEPSGGNRIVSIFVYLSDCEAGGHTHFPTIGVRRAPVCGAALLWHNIERHGLLDARTLHAGEPVESGTKWGMNIWLRQRPRPGEDAATAAAPPWPRVGAPPLTATTPKARESRTLKERT